jgi:hypothetical protein
MANGKFYQTTEAQRTAAVMDKVKNGRLSDLSKGAKTPEQAIQMQRAAVDRAEKYMDTQRISKTIEGKSALRTEALRQNPNIGKDATEVREAVQKQTPAEFSKNIDKSAFSPAVLGAMDNKQMYHLATKGSVAKRNAVKDLVRTPEGRAQIKTHASTIKDPTERANLARNIKSARAFTKPPSTSKPPAASAAAPEESKVIVPTGQISEEKVKFRKKY